MDHLPHMKGWTQVHPEHDEGAPCNFHEDPCYYRPTLLTQIKSFIREYQEVRRDVEQMYARNLRAGR